MARQVRAWNDLANQRLRHVPRALARRAVFWSGELALDLSLSVSRTDNARRYETGTSA